MTLRIGVDVGGTFTDLIAEDDERGAVAFAKVPSTPDDPSRGVLAAVEAAGEAIDLDRAELVHGHTVGLNALLERRGAEVGLLATAGFRDTLEIGRGDRGDPYDLFWQRSAPLVPRRRRLPIGERVGADGSVVLPLPEGEVREAVATLLADGVDCVAIAFVNAYANPAHELRAAEIVRGCGFDGEIALSHLVSGEYREYERTCTTVIDAYIRPRVARYLGSLDEQLRARGLGGDVLVARSGGGAMELAQARARPFESIMSGPVGGAQGAVALVEALDLGDAVTADVGGTSFDTCLIAGGRPRILHEGSVVGLPLQTSWVDVRSVGAGGGSIARVDEGGLLRVGPDSAGAVPGPACYRCGGELPTVTDAALVLGMLGHGRLASGLELSAELARGALEPPATQLGLDVHEVARGTMTIAAASMGGAIREITIEQGLDPRGMALIAFGGAGPLFATLLADELGIERIVVPPDAGNFSAHGLLDAEVTRAAARTRLLAVAEESLAAVAETLDELLGGLGAERRPDDDAEARLDLRYVGQEHTLTLELPLRGREPAIGVEALHERFDREYQRVYGHRMDGDVEIVTVRAALRAPREPRTRRVAPRGGSAVAADEISAFSHRRSSWATFAVLDREAIAAPVRGPAIVAEPTTTLYLDDGWAAEPVDGGALLARRSR